MFPLLIKTIQNVRTWSNIGGVEGDAFRMSRAFGEHFLCLHSAIALILQVVRPKTSL